jgi:glycosyltransferase involved in cell wall biosynthesis
MQPLVSILIPAYNAQEWISETIHSALEQTWARKEIIIVDDGSKDGTLAIAQTFNSAGVKVITQENQGAAAARNKAFSLCEGNYIQWLDADDLLAPDKIARQMEAVLQGLSPRTVLSSAWGSFYYRASKAKFVPSELWCSLSPVDWLVLKLKHCSYMPTTTWLVSRELTNAAGPWDTRLLGDDDGEFFFRVMKVADGIRFVPDARVFYRMSGVNRLSYVGRSDKKLDAQYLGMKMQIESLLAISNDEKTRTACLNYLQLWLVYFYPNRMDLVEKMRQLAAGLGEQLSAPKLSLKYRWLEKTLGLKKAKDVQLNYNEWKTSILQWWDLTMLRAEKRNLPSSRDKTNSARQPLG